MSFKTVEAMGVPKLAARRGDSGKFSYHLPSTGMAKI
jgi:hypothetical protein